MIWQNEKYAQAPLVLKRLERAARVLAILLVTFSNVPSGNAAQPDDTVTAQSVYEPTQENLEARQWFQDAKFGIFLHWGLYSSLGGVEDSEGAEWIMQGAKIPASKYEVLARFFNPIKFDANAWVMSFKAAGAKYIVITAKHHDGFSMYRSKASRYNIYDATPFKRDPMAELAEACRKHGIKLFFYYSQLDWHHPDYFPRGTTGRYSDRPESGNWDRYIDYQDDQLKELLTQYGPIGGIWFDGWWDQEKTSLKNRWRLEETYRLIHKLQPQALIVNNHHQSPFQGEDYQGFEKDLPGDNNMGFNKAGVSNLPLEMSETMGDSWGFSLLDEAKSPEQLVRTMVNAAGRNANFLMNTGPMPNGEIQPDHLDTMSKIGDWVKLYGSSIYETRGGPLAPRTWGVTTQNGKTIYVHILEKTDGRLFLPITSQIISAVSLNTGNAVQFQSSAKGVELLGAFKQVDEWDHIVKIKIK